MLHRTAIGRAAERLARAHLEAEGYRIEAANFVCRGGELDLIADEAGVLCFVEVRSRAGEAWGSPLESIDWRKRRRLLHAAGEYLRRTGSGGRAARFDVVAVVGGRVTALVRDAFRREGR